MTMGLSRKGFLSNVVKTIVVRDDKIGYAKGCLDVHDHLGEVQPLGLPGEGHLPRGAPGIDFFAKFL